MEGMDEARLLHREAHDGSMFPLLKRCLALMVALPPPSQRSWPFASLLNLCPLMLACGSKARFFTTLCETLLLFTPVIRIARTTGNSQTTNETYFQLKT